MRLARDLLSASPAEQSHDDRVSDRLVFDILTAVLLLVCGVGGAYTALFMSWRARKGGTSTLLFQLGNCLSGGVMMGAGFCHLLGEAAQELTPLYHYPMAPLLAAIGFLVTLLADQVVASYDSSDGSHHGHDAAPHSCHSVGPLSAVWGTVEASGASVHEHAAPERVANGDVELTASRVRRRSGDVALRQAGTHGHGTRDKSEAVADRDGGGAGERWEATEEEGEALLGVSAVPGVVPGVRPALDPTLGVLGESPRAVLHGQGEQRGASFAGALILAIALSIHSVMEGAAMGAQTRLESSFDVFIAILAHKGLASYALGSSLLDANIKVGRFNAIVWFFASSTPIGIFLGFAIRCGNGFWFVSGFCSDRARGA